MHKNTKMKELIATLNQAAKVYYQGQDEIMSNFEYDALYDELVKLEKETGVILAGSPTVSVGYEILNELPKEAHISSMLSLDKTKEVSALEDFLSEYEGVLSYKLDGLSIVVTYENGILTKALTRGNGEVGEIVTNNAKVFQNIPQRISFKGRLVLRGEALIRYSDFELLNNSILDDTEKYKNPRNLCSGSVRQLNNEITAKRRVNYLLYSMIKTDDKHIFALKTEQLEWLEQLGFEVVPYKKVTKATLSDAVKAFEKEVENNDLPSDGLVLSFNDIMYSHSLGNTAKFPRDSIAFKWKDELAETTLLDIEWSASRTGLINPVAIFGPVQLEGTTVSRASVHNISILKELKLGIGDTITVYKANMIIPQIHENLTKSDCLKIPIICPICGEPTERTNEKGTECLICPNKKCDAKKIKLFTHFVSRNAMNIDGLSESTLEKFISVGILHEPADLFHLEQHKEVLIEMEGLGKKSYQNLIEAIEKARTIPMPRLIYSLGIKGIGLSMAKLICNEYPMGLPDMKSLTVEQLSSINGVGEVLATNFVNFFNSKENEKMIASLWREVIISKSKMNTNATLEGKTFVITGSLNHFSNRDECKERIENVGGKVKGSVSKNTDYLVNNDTASNSSKNKKAKQLGVSIVSEEELIHLLDS